MTVKLLATMQALGEYGGLTGATATGTSAFGTLVARSTTFLSDHTMAVVVVLVIVVGFVWWMSSPN
jgi:hypothetical protein